MPGREYCGELIVADIGIPETVLETICPSVFHNGPEIWADHYPWPAAGGHKYQRGHAVIAGGDVMLSSRRESNNPASRHSGLTDYGFRCVLASE